MNIKIERLKGVLLISMFFLSVLTVTVPRARAFEYPSVPLLKVMPESVTGVGLDNTFVVDVYAMGVDPFWDIGGFDIQMNFRRSEPPYLIIEALDVTVDPDGWLTDYWGGAAKSVRVDNAAGTVNVFIVGFPGATPLSGSGRLFSVTFREIYEYEEGTSPPSVEITLRNPPLFRHRATLDADAGLIDLTSPVGTQWHGISLDDFGRSFSLDDWVDVDGDGELGPGDELTIADTSTGMWHPYLVHDMKGTLELTQQPFRAVDDYIWMADFPNDGLENFGLPGRTVTGSTGDEYNGFGMPYWTGNFSLTYAVDSVNEIVAHFLPFTADEYTQVLVEGVDYLVHADEDLIELLVPLDVPIINEHWVDGVNNTLNGWPYINYLASGIESVYRRFPAYVDYYGETEGFATFGYATPPPIECWYDPDWPWELEGWWALGYGPLSGPYTWPDGTEWWINYTAASYITVDFNADPDPRPYYVEFDGTYEEFLALGNPVGTSWNEVYPNPLNSYTLVDSWWAPGGAFVVLESAAGIQTYLVEGSATDITVDQFVTIDDIDPASPFYGMERIVDVAGFPHPEREMSPWHGRDSSGPIPHVVENGLYTPAMETVVRRIDLIRRSAWHKKDGMDVSLYAMVENVGPAMTYGKVVFTITTAVGIPVGIEETERILLAPGEIYGDKKDARYFTMWTAPTSGRYYVTAAAWYQDGQGDWHLSPDKPKSFSFNIKP